ncbi:hypothetical protein FRC15_003122 [Serendipita sp. 397]|nr:hypothetical protein FRC15_003122 [Serendipita sp. 397]
MNKGKGRVLQYDIIELSDSDSDEDIPSHPTFDAWKPQDLRKRPVPNRETSGVSSLAANPGANTTSQTSVAELVQEPPTAGPSSTIDSLEALITSVLEVIPDVDPQYVAELYLQYSSAVQTLTATSFSFYMDPIIGSLVDDPDYPKVNPTSKRKRGENGAGPSTKRRKIEPVPNVVKLDLLSPNRPPINSPDYFNLSMYWLGVMFPRVRKNFIGTRLGGNRGLYAPTFVQLSKELLNLPPTVLKKQKTRPFFNGPPWRSRDFDREYEWCLDWFPEKSGQIEWIEDPKSGTTDDTSGEPVQDEKIESEEAEPGEGVDCGCCFSEYVVSTMIQCPEGHLFCKACVLAFSQERLGQRNAKIKCMNQDDCTTEFGRAQLEQCLPEKLLGLYDRVKQDDDIAAACLEGLEECPFCDYKCVIENEMERLFHCLNDDCGIVSCRNCKKQEHLPKTCEEARYDSNLDAQHEVEEAMTNALMRICPNAKCQATFVKTDGCNKITCAKCGQLSCYICRQPIKGYDHFNQTPGATQATRSKKCALWDAPTTGGVNTNGLEQRHHEEVARAREEAFAKLRTQNPDVDLNKIRVDAPENVAQPPRPVSNPVRNAFGPVPLPRFFAFPPGMGQPPLPMPLPPPPPPIFLPAIPVAPGMPPILPRDPAPWPAPRLACQCPRCVRNVGR